jgi:hypothetical protein
VTIQALAGKYRYKRKKVTQELEDNPEKKHPVSDVIDAGGYLLLGIVNSPKFRRKAMQGLKPSAPLQQKISARAWT